MGRRGNPYDTAMAESLMKTLKVEGSVHFGLWMRCLLKKSVRVMSSI